MKFTYLLINFATLLFPLLFSLEEKIHFVRKWPALFPGLTLTALFFIGFDYVFTVWGVWGFNPDYLTGIFAGVLPVEEVMFFFSIPFACLFIFEVTRYYLPGLQGPGWLRYVFLVSGFFLMLAGLLNSDLIYTSVKLSLTGLALLFAGFWFQPGWMGHFALTFLIHLVPFLVVNGILTALPVVWYNNQENLGLRIGTIPVEDVFYSLLLLLMNTAFYHFFSGKRPDRATV